MDSKYLIKQLIEKYKESMEIRNCATATIRGKIRYLEKFFEYLATVHDIYDLNKITKDIIYEYQLYEYKRKNLKGRLNTIAVQNNALKPIKDFFKFLKEKDYIIADPTIDISYAKEPKNFPRGILTIPEVRKMLQVPDLTNPIGYRDKTIMEVLYSSGIRKSELNNLMLRDVDYIDGFLTIEQGKGKKDRVVPIGEAACKYLENYINSIRTEFIKIPYNDYLFLSNRGNRLYNNAVWYLIKKYGKKAGIKKNVFPHGFRHTCATSMLRNNANIKSIQEILGHSCLSSTQIYIHVTITELKETHKRCHPRERDKL